MQSWPSQSALPTSRDPVPLSEGDGERGEARFAAPLTPHLAFEMFTSLSGGRGKRGGAWLAVSVCEADIRANV